MTFEESIELPCGDYVELYVTGREVQVSVSDGSVETYLPAETAERFAQAFAQAAEAAKENGRKHVLQGKRVVLTGKFDGGREAVEKRVREAGGVVAGRISPGTIVLTGNLPYDGTWKSKNALSNGGTIKRYADLNYELQAVGI